MLNDADLKKIVTEFSRPREEFNGENYITRKRIWFETPMQEIRPLILKENINSLTLEDAKKIYKEMTVGGPKLYPHTFIDNGLDKIINSLKYLLYDEDNIEERFYNFTSNPDSDFHLSGVGKAFASTALFLINHHEYPIWNGAIDGGLKMLGMFPEKKRGEHQGLHYLRIQKVMKNLTEKCKFKDLSITDEFIELIYHNTIGSDVLTDYESQIDSNEDKSSPKKGKLFKPKDKDNIHLKNQYYLAKIGMMRNYDVWIAYNDRNKTFNNVELNSISLNELPHFAGPNVLRIARSIDVIWFKKGSAQPISFFEIEHTTSIYSGLLRLNDVKIDYPIPNAYIVGPNDREKLFDSQIQRMTFVYSELSEVCQFMSYSDLEELFTAYEKINTLL